MEKRYSPGKGWFIAGAMMAAAAVVLDAFGAHGLNRFVAQFVDIEKRIEGWETAVRLHMLHAISLVVLGVLVIARGSNRLIDAAAVLFIAGIALFSGCLYVWVVFDVFELARIVPFGGLAFIVGWITAALGVIFPWPRES
jgi:uncharacterized membrane protein YgdD (TMEM256/DUF423 family)